LSAHAYASQIWVAISGDDQTYLDAATALRSSLPDDEVRIGDWHDFNFRMSPPRVLVTIGSEALVQLQRNAEKMPIVALLTPRHVLDAVRQASNGRVTGIYSEQPLERQVALLSEAFPGKKRVGVLLGPTSAPVRNELSTLLRRASMEGVFGVVNDKRNVAETAQAILSNCDIFLALPDAEAINGQSARFILLASYRRNIPVVGFSSSFVKAGAAVALVSSPAQIGREAARLIQDLGWGRKPPGPRASSDFEVLVNSSVSRSLGLDLAQSELERQMRIEETSP